MVGFIPGVGLVLRQAGFRPEACIRERWSGLPRAVGLFSRSGFDGASGDGPGRAAPDYRNDLFPLGIGEGCDANPANVSWGISCRPALGRHTATPDASPLRA